MYRVAVTTLETFRQFVETEEGSEDWVIDAIKRIKDIPTIQMQLGTAFHSILEHPERYLIAIHHPVLGAVVYYKCNGFTFHPDDVRTAIQQLPVRGFVNEIPVIKTYSTAYGLVTVSGRIDRMDGLDSSDHKTRWDGEVDPYKYLDSCQHKYYLSALGTDEFIYYVYHMESQKTGEYDARLKSIYTFKYSRHDDMELYCENLLGWFMQYVASKDLLEYLLPVEGRKYELF